mgnify:CR=1 FL=1
MKKILVPCDFSEPAIEAFRFAIDVAEQSNGIVHLVYVAEPPVSSEPILMPYADLEEQLFSDLRSKTAIEFDKITNRYFNEKVKVISEMEFGTPSRKILDYIIKHSIDLVVMGSHGASGLREMLIGSNAEKIVRHATVPVLVIKNYVNGPIKNIVFPNTFETDHLEELVMKIKALQNFFNAQLHLVWINTPVNFISDSIMLERLRSFAKRHMLKNFTINVYNNISEEGGILKFTKSINADLIAMGTHGRKGIKHLLIGSVAEDVVNHTDTPIWTYVLKDELVDA